MKSILITAIAIFILVIAGIFVINRMNLVLEGKDTNPLAPAPIEAFYYHQPGLGGMYSYYQNYQNYLSSSVSTASQQFPRSFNFYQSSTYQAPIDDNPKGDDDYYLASPAVPTPLPAAAVPIPVVPITSQEIIVPLFPVSGSSESGSAIISSTGFGTTRITIHLENYIPANVQPAFVQIGSCSEPGGIAYNLVSANNGFSQTNLGIPIEALFESPLSINVQRSRAQAFVTELCGDI